MDKILKTYVQTYLFWDYLSKQKTNIIQYPLYGESKMKWYKLIYLQNRNRLIDLENEFMVAKGKDGGKG